jgi:predicted transcriptional regulator
MKIKRLKVEVRSLAEGLQKFGATLKAVQSGKTLPKRTGVYFVSVEAMRQVLTTSRLALLNCIRTRHPRSIAALAKLAGRDFKNVHPI